MATCFGPLFCIGASGDISKAMQFVCGSYARKKPWRYKDEEEPITGRARRFKEAVQYWQHVPWTAKANWKYFANKTRMSEQCSSGKAVGTGYNLFIMFFLRFYNYGPWAYFPGPPGFGLYTPPKYGWPPYPPEQD